MIVMATMMIPGEATIISNYLTVSKLGWLDSYPVLIVPYLTSAMGIFLFRQFYMSFPISLYESAKMDGCSNLRFIFQILIPLTEVRNRGNGSLYLYQCMEHVYVATSRDGFLDLPHGADRNRYA